MPLISLRIVCGAADRILVIFLGAVLLLGAGTSAQQKTSGRTSLEPNLKYDTPGVALEGTLIERQVYGPPGFGETPAKDERDSILVLKLRRPITVEPLADAKSKDSASLDTARDIREVQLFVDRSQIANARKLVSKMVIAVGTLNEAVAPSQYTKVWLDTKTLHAK